MQMIIAVLSSALRQAAEKIELCPTQGKTYKFDSWLHYNSHIIIPLAEPQRTLCNINSPGHISSAILHERWPQKPL